MRCKLSPDPSDRWKSVAGFGISTTSDCFYYCRLGIDFLSGANCRTILDRLPSYAGEHVLERGQDADCIEIVVVSQVRDPEQLSLHLALTVCHDRSKAVAKLFYDCAGVDPARRLNRSKRCRWRRGCEQFQSQSLRTGASHLRCQLSVFDQRGAASYQIAVAHLSNEIERRS